MILYIIFLLCLQLSYSSNNKPQKLIIIDNNDQYKNEISELICNWIKSDYISFGLSHDSINNLNINNNCKDKLTYVDNFSNSLDQWKLLSSKSIFELQVSSIQQDSHIDQMLYYLNNADIIILSIEIESYHSYCINNNILNINDDEYNNYYLNAIKSSKYYSLINNIINFLPKHKERLFSINTIEEIIKYKDAPDLLFNTNGLFYNNIKIHIINESKIEPLLDKDTELVVKLVAQSANNNWLKDLKLRNNNYINCSIIGTKDYINPLLSVEDKSILLKIRNNLFNNKLENKNTSQTSDTRLLCLVYTISPYHMNIEAIINTWGKRCDGFLALSNQTDFEKSIIYIYDNFEV
jgi:hypothetical protein